MILTPFVVKVGNPQLYQCFNISTFCSSINEINLWENNTNNKQEEKYYLVKTWFTLTCIVTWTEKQSHYMNYESTVLCGWQLTFRDGQITFCNHTRVNELFSVAVIELRSIPIPFKVLYIWLCWPSIHETDHCPYRVVAVDEITKTRVCLQQRETMSYV